MAKYYVYSNLKGKPYYIHTSYEEALAEAKRLAMKENLVFEVLKIKSSVVPEMTISVIEEKDHIPDVGKKVECEGNDDSNNR